MTLKVGIIGAGIGGLSAAIALRRTGAQVEIFERSNFQNEIGAAITITPNGMRILQHFGFDPTLARGVENKQMRMVDPYTLKDLLVEDFRQVEDDYVVSSDESYPGPPVIIHNGHSVAKFDCGGGKIVLDNGDVFKKDLVVVADGVRTKLISEIAQQDIPLEDVGSSFYRCLIPFDEINKDPELAAIFKDQDPGFWVPFELSTGTFLVTYPCRDQKMLNVAFRHKTKTNNKHADDWNTDTNIEDLIAMVERFNPLLPKLFGLTSSVSVHKVFRREPLETYTSGRAVIIGDAAHPIQPTHGKSTIISKSPVLLLIKQITAQGAVLAIEEAASLEALFTNVRDPNQVAERLRLYDDILKPRIHATQLLSDATPGLSGSLRKRAEDVWGEGMFPPEAMNFTKPVRDFFYGWDVKKVADDVLAQRG
ncbi:hypothetical protein F53441_12151 [Fusarium austroafricanum]|uniref:FAD-binding domain-containing protein n=1 Tax=Fusarium austroafricanum TaxID=2364996 RepID=A0A8H4JXN7_9HYPO|nr:hypothetical protein F53441_12151 [Fusarium austroafricanum]